jgi:hypothetical protein
MVAANVSHGALASISCVMRPHLLGEMSQPATDAKSILRQQRHELSLPATYIEITHLPHINREVTKAAANQVRFVHAENI